MERIRPRVSTRILAGANQADLGKYKKCVETVDIPVRRGSTHSATDFPIITSRTETSGELIMKRASRFIVANAVIVMASIGQANAAVIFDNGSIGPPLNFGAHFTQANTGFRVADDFSLAASNTIRSVEFWGVHWTSGVIPGDDTFDVAVFGNSGGLPDPGNIIGTSTLSLVSRVDTGFDHNSFPGADILNYVMDLSTPILIPDTSLYWFSLRSTTSAVTTTFAWQDVTGGLGSKAQSSNNGATWGMVSDNVAFQLSDTFASTAAIPEPTSLALLGMTAAGFCGVRLRRRRREDGDQAA